jgi:Protein of unknown function (DUF1397)
MDYQQFAEQKKNQQLMVHDKCVEAPGSDDVFEKLKRVAKNCLKKSKVVNELADVINIQLENSTTVTKESVNTLCGERHAFLECFKTYINAVHAVSQCLDEQETSLYTTFIDILTNLSNFFCSNEGDRIACKLLTTSLVYS